MIFLTCPHCQTMGKVKGEMAGKRFRCPTCKNIVAIPLPEPAPANQGQASPAVPDHEAENVSARPSAPKRRSLAEVGPLPPLAAQVVKGPHIDNANGLSGPAVAQTIRSPQRYQVGNEIARGGMGAIMRAVDQDINREVALKFLLNQADSRLKTRFIEEAKITGQLEHPNIVPIHDLSVDGQGQLYFSMKLVKGRSLAAILEEQREDKVSPKKDRGTPYTLGRLLTIFSNICNALAYAHARHVIHRDLKPANVMVGDFGEVYVMDWGLAKVLDQEVGARGQEIGVKDPKTQTKNEKGADQATMADKSSEAGSAAKVQTNRPLDSGLTQDGAVMGTPAYMPPEQAKGETSAIDERSDIYSLGAILYEILTLTPPVGRGGDYLAVLLRVALGEIEAPEKRAPERVRKGWLPPELSAIAMKALAKEPDKRYQTVEALKRDIELYLEGRSVSAKQDSAWEMFQKLVKRNKGASAGMALALLVLLTSLGFLFAAWFETDKAYAAYRDQLAKSLPAFVKAAHLAVEQRQFNDALAQVELALATAPEEPAPRLLKAQLLMIRQDFAAAENELEHYLRTQPADEQARKLRGLCQQARPDDVDQLLKVAAVFYEQGGYALTDLLLRKYGKDSTEARQFLLKMYRERIENIWKGKGPSLTMDVSGLKLRLYRFYDLTDLSPLKGMPLTSLEIIDCGGMVRNLSPLVGMPLTTLNCPGAQIADLSPLKGMPLTILNCGGNPITNLSPLQGMPLTTLDLTDCTRVRDLTPLQGMPLTSLNIQRCSQVADLTPLQGMKLTYLGLNSCAQVRDLSPLDGMPLNSLNLLGCAQLRNLTGLEGMPFTSLNLQGCNQLRDLAALRGMKLAGLKLADCSSLRDLTPLQGMQLTSLDLGGCTQLPNLTGLQGMPLTGLNLTGCAQVQDLAQLRGMKLTGLTLTGCIQVRDLTGLQGMPLTSLGLSGCTQVRDLTPLQEMALTDLNLYGTKVQDLAPLKGMKLTILDLRYCAQVQDLTPLQGMKFTSLDLTGCAQLRDLTGLQGMQLTGLKLVDCTQVRDLTPLQGMKLSSLNLSGCAQLRDLTGLQGMQLTTLVLTRCPQVPDLAPLAGMKLTGSLDLTGCTQLRDLTGLQGMPLTSLSLPGCVQVSDLAPLKGMKLTYLTLEGCAEVRDLAPLQGMSLANLQLEGCRQVRDLTPLKGMPLTTLNLYGSGVQDVTPLQGMSLQRIHVIPKAISTGMEVLRRMKGLEKIVVAPGTTVGLAPEVFWKKYDAGEFNK